MARIWKRITKHAQRNYLYPVGKETRSPHDFRPYETWYVNVCSFTFQFTHIDQLDLCLSYYQQKIHSSSMLPFSSIEPLLDQRSWEIPRWFERLPMYLLEEPKRNKVVQALERARALWREDIAKVTGSKTS